MAKKHNAPKKAKTLALSSSSTAKPRTNSTEKKLDLLPENLLLPASKFAKERFRIEEIHPGCIWVIHDFLDPQECQAWIDFVEQSKELELCGHPASRYVAHRECYRWQRDDSQVASLLFDRMKKTGVLQEIEEKVSFPTGSYTAQALNPNIRFYKYTKGMSFGKHVDGTHHVKGVGTTEVTTLIYLSECEGGATRFYPSTSSKKAKSMAFAPKIGAMLLHIHGDRCLEHEADPVESGIKYILRTDVVYGD